VPPCLNGLQYGLLLFLLGAGLKRVFGIVDNLVHRSFCMLSRTTRVWV
jgi:hypothetical protein